MKNPSKPIIQWYSLNGRALPWRKTRNPYHIWISEVILQQTRVAQGIEYYLRFIHKFPDVKSLALASLDEVLKEWEGLGYYSRARNLHHSAKEIAINRRGQFPTDYREWEKLKGIGPYTARAIGSLAYHNKVAVIDGNVFRVLSRYLGDFSPVNQPATRKKFQEILDRWIQKADSASFNQGMMETGALICLPKKPLCELCPIENHCVARELGIQNQLPVKDKKLSRKTQWFEFYLVYDAKGRVLIQQRSTAKGIWRGLWEIPNKVVTEMDWIDSKKKKAFLGNFRHVLTHIDMEIAVIQKVANKNALHQPGVKFISRQKVAIFAFPKAILKIFSAFWS